MKHERIHMSIIDIRNMQHAHMIVGISRVCGAVYLARTTLIYTKHAIQNMLYLVQVQMDWTFLASPARLLTTRFQQARGNAWDFIMC